MAIMALSLSPSILDYDFRDATKCALRIVQKSKNGHEISLQAHLYFLNLWSLHSKKYH